MYYGEMRNLLFVLLSFALLTSCGGQAKSQKERTRSSQAQELTDKRPTYLYKVVSRDDWAKSCESVHLPSTDADFIHLAMEDQLDRIIEKYWAGTSEYVILKIETAKLVGNLVLEANPGGTNQYYHLYNGSIPLSAIVESKVKNT